MHRHQHHRRFPGAAAAEVVTPPAAVRARERQYGRCPLVVPHPGVLIRASRAGGPLIPLTRERA